MRSGLSPSGLMRLLLAGIGVIVAVGLDASLTSEFASSMAMAYLVLVVAGEGLIFFVRRNVTPYTLFTLGWPLPFLIANFPLRSFIFTAEPLNAGVKGFSIIIIVLFYAVSFLSEGIRQTMTSRAGKIHRPTGGFNVGPAIPSFMLIALFAVSNAGFLIGLYSAGWKIPLFQAYVTGAAREFFAISGSATLFHAGKVALLLVLVGLIWPHQGSKSKVMTTLLVLLSVLYIAETVLQGKRMGAITTALAMMALAGAVYRMPRKPIFVIGCFFVAVILGNGFLRAQYGYQQYWEGKHFSAVESSFELALLMPVKYTHGAFYNLDNLLEKWHVTADNLGDYTICPIINDAYGNSRSVYNRARELNQMVPAMGASIEEGGAKEGILWAFVVFSMVWLFYALRFSKWGLIVYALFASEIGVLWTGNFISRAFIYQYIIIFTFWFFYALFRSLGSLPRVKNYSRA